MIEVQQDLVQHFLACRPRLMGFVLAMTRDHHVTEELVQDLFLEVTREAARGTSPADPFTWLMGMARHRVVDHFRSRARDQRDTRRLIELADAAADAFAEHQPLHEPAEDESHLELLRGCMAKLTARTRSLLDARYRQSLKIDQIAAAIGWKTASVKVALAKTRRVLADCVARKLRSGGGT